MLSAIVYAIVNRPHEATIDAYSDEVGATVSVRAQKADAHHLIGHGGDIARAIRTITLGVSAKHKRKCTVKFVIGDDAAGT